MPAWSSASFGPTIKHFVRTYGTHIEAGGPFPLDEDGGEEISLDALLMQNPQATFFMRVEGGSLVHEGIFSGDIVVIDRSKQARQDDMVLVVLDDAFSICRLSDFARTGGMVVVWGVVVASVHMFRT